MAKKIDEFITKYMTGNPANLIAKLNIQRSVYYMKESEFTISIICGDTRYFYCLDPEFQQRLHLFRMTKKDFNDWIEKGGVLEEGMWGYHPTRENTFFDKKVKTIKYDINHAYWQIALNHGFISQKTYEAGLKIKEAGGRLSKIYCLALSAQGAPDTYRGYKEDKRIDDAIQFPENLKMRQIYNFIRNKTYYHMDWLAYKLGNDFKSYNVDCIEFANTKKNCTFVQKYFKEHNLSFKIV